MPLSISNVSIWEQIYNGVTKRSLIAKKLKHLVSIQIVNNEHEPTSYA